LFVSLILLTVDVLDILIRNYAKKMPQKRLIYPNTHDTVEIEFI